MGDRGTGRTKKAKRLGNSLVSHLVIGSIGEEKTAGFLQSVV